MDTRERVLEQSNQCAYGARRCAGSEVEMVEHTTTSSRQRSRVTPRREPELLLDYLTRNGLVNY